MLDDASELPAYSPPEDSWSAPPPPTPRELVTHTFPLSTKQGKPWAELVVLSKAPTPKSLPRLIEGEPVSGWVKIDLPEEMPMKSVTVEVSDFSRLAWVALTIFPGDGRIDK